MSKSRPTGSGDALPAVIDPDDAGGRVSRAILDFVSHIPASRVDNHAQPEAEARRLANRAAQRAALTAGSLALPPGPLGWLTVLPELLAIWKIQAQLVSDIAAAYGRHAELGREQMLGACSATPPHRHSATWRYAWATGCCSAACRTA